MATSTSVCAVCDLQHKTTQSTDWCIECEEPLCSDCRKYHNVLKATRNHKTISISDYKLIPSAVTDINQNCVYHNEIYQLYCIKHESPICNKCVKDHGKCGEILSLNDIVTDIKTSDSFVDLEQSLDGLFTFINLIRKDRESNIECIAQQTMTIVEQVCHLKEQVIQRVNKLEEEFIRDLIQTELSCCDPIRSIISSLHDKAKETNQMKLELKNTKKYASDIQTLLSMRAVQAKIIDYEKYLQFSIDNKNHEKINIKGSINTKVHDVLNVDRFGSIHVIKSPSTNFDLQRRKHRQAQIILPTAIKSINDVKLVLERKLNTNCHYSTGCCATKQGGLIVTGEKLSRTQVVSINAEGEVEYTIPLTEPNCAFDVASIDEYTVAVSTGVSSQKFGISIVDLSKRKIMRFIDLPEYPYGITFDGKSLICCVADKELYVISVVDYRITKIPKTASSWSSSISTHSNKIFYTDSNAKKVICCSYSGATFWEFKFEKVIYDPRGIAIDNNGNVFVAGNNTCNVIVISADGKQCKEILTQKDRLYRPTSIFFDKERNQLSVVDGSEFAYVYNVSYF